MPETATTDPQPLRKACDQCRTRKYKCTGEPTGCTRCVSDGIGNQCRYSGRGAMGRPPKGGKAGVGLSSKEKSDGVKRAKKRKVQEGDEKRGRNEHLESWHQGQSDLGSEEMNDAASGGMGIWDTVEDTRDYDHMNVHGQLQAPLSIVSARMNELPPSLSHTQQYFSSHNFRQAFVSPFDKVDILPGVLGNSNNPHWPFDLRDKFGVDPFATLEMQLARGDLEGAGLFDNTGVGDMEGGFGIGPNGFEFNDVYENRFHASTNSGFSSAEILTPTLDYTLDCEEPAAATTTDGHIPPEPNPPTLPSPQDNTQPSSTNPSFPFPTLPACICPSSFHECHKALQSATIILKSLLSSFNIPTVSIPALTTCYSTAMNLGKITLGTCRNLITCSICAKAGMPNMLLVGAVLPVMVGVYEGAIRVLLDERFYGGHLDKVMIAGIKASKWRRMAIEALRRDMTEVENLAQEMVTGTVVGFKKKVVKWQTESFSWKSKGEALYLRHRLRELEEREKERVNEREKEKANEKEKERANEKNPGWENRELASPDMTSPPTSQAASINMDPPLSSRATVQSNSVSSPTHSSSSLSSYSSSSGSPPATTTDTTSSPFGSNLPQSHVPRERWEAIVGHLSENPNQELPPCIKTVLEMQDHVLLWTSGIELVYERGMKMVALEEDVDAVNEEQEKKRRETVERLRAIREQRNGIVIEWDGGGVVVEGPESGIC